MLEALVSDITSNTLQVSASAAHMVAVEMPKQSLVNEKKRPSSLLVESNKPNLIALSSDSKSSNHGHGLLGSSMKMEAKVSKCTPNSAGVTE